MIKKSDLDKRICDLEEVENAETYREYIRSSEEFFEIKEQDIDNMSDKELNKYLDFIDYIWTK